MRDDVVAGIELLTGRRVLSLMSDHDADHDYAAEVFSLDGPPIIDAAGDDIGTGFEPGSHGS
jgi:hypothetical protein